MNSPVMSAAWIAFALGLPAPSERVKMPSETKVMPAMACVTGTSRANKAAPIVTKTGALPRAMG